MRQFLKPRQTLVVVFLFFNTSLVAQTSTVSQNSTSEFSSGAISFGVVVSNMKKSMTFYKEVLGMVETGGFPIDREFGRKSGLSNGKPFNVTILKTINDENATEWKLVSFKKKATHPEQKYIQDDTGVQYATMFVKSLDPFLARIKKAKVKLLGKTPVSLGDGRYLALIQDPDGTFIELIGPMSSDK